MRSRQQVHSKAKTLRLAWSSPRGQQHHWYTSFTFGTNVQGFIHQYQELGETDTARRRTSGVIAYVAFDERTCSTYVSSKKMRCAYISFATFSFLRKNCKTTVNAIRRTTRQVVLTAVIGVPGPTLLTKSVCRACMSKLICTPPCVSCAQHVAKCRGLAPYRLPDVRDDGDLLRNIRDKDLRALELLAVLLQQLHALVEPDNVPVHGFNVPEACW